MIMTTTTLMTTTLMTLVIVMMMTIQMLSGYHSGDQQAKDALTQYTWIIIPVVNPDGYIYTWTDVRQLGCYSSLCAVCSLSGLAELPRGIRGRV